MEKRIYSMGFLIKKQNMIYIYITIIFGFMFTSCGINERNENHNKKNNLKLDYVIEENLSSKDYSNTIGYFPKEGLIPNASIAFGVAEIILIQIYGERVVEKEKPFSINLENDIWIIEGNLDKDMQGGVIYVEIKKQTGEILKVIHTK